MSSLSHIHSSTTTHYHLKTNEAEHSSFLEHSWRLLVYVTHHHTCYHVADRLLNETAVPLAQNDAPKPELLEAELLQGFIYTIRLVDQGYALRGEEGFGTAKELLAGYIRCFKQSASRLAVDPDSDSHILTWDAIINAFKGTVLFRNHPNILLEINPDLVNKFSTSILLHIVVFTTSSTFYKVVR